LNKEFKTFVYYSLIIFAGTLINFFNYRIDLWIVNYYLSDESLSYYSLASNIAQIIIYTSVTIGTVILPYLSSKNIEERKSMFPKITRYSFSFFVIVIVIAYIISEYIIPLVYGKAFYDAVKPFKILLPGVLFSCQTQLIATLIVASKKNTLNIIATGTGLIFTIALDLYLIPLWGIEGAAWATTISYMIIFTITYYLFLKYLKYPFVNYFFVNWQDINSIIKFFRK
jgi:O-antigen/teichoic acid export membrane protein